MDPSKTLQVTELVFTGINAWMRILERVKDGEDIPDSEIETLRQLVDKKEDEFLSL